MAPESFLASILALNSISSGNNNHNNHHNNNNDSSATTPAPAAAVSTDGIADAGARLSDVDLASRRAEEAASRRYQAAEWLRKMVGVVGSKDLPNEPSEEEFRLGLRNGLILCNVINKVNPGSVPKVVDNPAPSVPPPDGAALSAYQYFENVRNFLVGVQELNLPNFEASDLEKGGSSAKVVDCILALKAFSDWKQTGGNGSWKFGGNLKPTNTGKPPIKSAKSFDPFTQSALKNIQQPIDSNTQTHGEKLPEDSSQAALNNLVHAILCDKKPEEVPTLVESMIAKVTQEFERRLATQGEQFTMVLKDLIASEDKKSFQKSKVLRALETVSGEHMVNASEDEEKQQTYVDQKGENEKYFSDSSNSSNDVDEYGNAGPNLQMHFNLQQKEIEELKYMLHNTREGVQVMQMEWNEEMYNIEKYVRGLAKAASGYHKVLEENRQLYNQVQDLKGSIRVYCRVRPFLPGQAHSQSTVDYVGDDGNLTIVNPAKQGKDSRRTFAFNKVFKAAATQEQVFLDTQPLIRSVLDGYNVCIFAYGQTGSGKTYTMTGPKVITEENWGVNYRALNDLFEISEQRMDAFTYDVAVQMIEIYNEQVRDLLVSDGSNKKLDIRNNSQQKGLNVPDANLVPVASTSAVIELMNLGHKNRVVGATALNDRSSRSHSVLTVHVQGKDLTSGIILRGCLHLVDLAGSERVDKSEATGERLKEAQHINKSLSALGDVIAALAQKNSHVPYRNSKLTQLLQDSLGGQAKTLMFVHISPEVDAYGETMSTLKFAERVATVELGAAKSNKESSEVRELKEQIANLKSALAKKEAEADQVQVITDSRISPETQRARNCVSPLHLRRQSVEDVQTEVNCRQPMEDVVNIEVRSDVTGRQKRPICGRDTKPEEIIDDSPLCGEDLGEKRKLIRLPSSGLPSPGLLSPCLPSPDRRLTMFDRGSHTKNKTKRDTFEEQDIRNWQDKVMVNKHMPMNGPPSQVDVYGSWEAHSLEKQDSLPEFYYQRCPSNLRKVYPDCEEEKFSLQQVHEMHRGMRSRIPDLKGKCEYEGQRTPLETDESEVELETRSKDDYLTSDSSEADLLWQFNLPNAPSVTPVEHVSRLKKPQQRIAKTPEGRSPSQAQALPAVAKLDRKMSNGNMQPQGRTGRQLPSGGIDAKRSSTGGKSKLEPRNGASK